jgi:muconolactone delta-isomerase
MPRCARMDVPPPHDIDPEQFERLNAEAKANAQKQQRSDKRRHAGFYSNVSISTWTAMTSCTPSYLTRCCSPSWK